jgi:uncharacterized protein (TIGR02646 family)
MMKLNRTGVQPPANWTQAAEKAFPDFTKFRQKAKAFEAFDIDDPVRRRGFKAFAPEVLPKTKKGSDFKAIWGRLKRSLAAMSHQKCAYCETPINAERAAAVEHFRPKSLFPTLVYDPDNYFLGCFGCNGAKLDRWPLGGTCYIRPDEDDPTILLAFQADGRVEAIAPANTAQTTIDDFKLNEGWLCKLRACAIQVVLEDLNAMLDKERIPAEVKEELARDALTRMRYPTRPYSVALSQCFQRVWNAKFPHALL